MTYRNDFEGIALMEVCFRRLIVLTCLMAVMWLACGFCRSESLVVPSSFVVLDALNVAVDG